nr:integrase, catalytic region, zinc finger, CCHC-type, peptidase aspartic, catalytic [Tanacetum cinerariifolium]
GRTTTHYDISLSEYDSFIYDFTHEEFADELTHIISPLEYDCFYFWDLPDPGKLQAKDDIGIFIGYEPKKKAYRIYNQRTQKIIENIHVDFDELTAMASEQLGLAHELQFMTPTTSM